MSELVHGGFAVDLNNPAIELPAAEIDLFKEALRLYAARWPEFWTEDGTFDFGGFEGLIEAELDVDETEAGFLMMRVVSFVNLMESDAALAQSCADIEDPDDLSAFAVKVAAEMPLRPWAMTPEMPIFDPAAFRAALRRAMH